MRLVNDQGVIVFKEAISLGFSQQNTIGHDLDQSLLRRAISKSNLKSHFLTKIDPQLIRQPLGDRPGSHPSGLGVPDEALHTSP